MKAMILAAGRGERMRPLTDTLPKPLIAVAGKPLIVHHIERLAQAGVQEIVINLGWLGHMIPEIIGDGSQWGVNIEYSDEQECVLETAGGIVKALPLLGDRPFLIVNGDIYCDIDYARLMTSTTLHLAHLILVDNPKHNVRGDFSVAQGVARNDGGPRYTYSGIGVYHPSVFKSLPIAPQKLAPLLRELIQQSQVSANIYRGVWHDVGTPDRLRELQAKLEKVK